MLTFILSFLFGLASGPGQTSPWPYQHLSKDNGLSNSAINVIYMDRHNLVWLGTWDGLNRYDGTSLKIYKPDSFIKGTISNNVVRNIVEDRLGNLWIITHKGINRYERESDSFRDYFTELNGLPYLEYNIRVCLGQDSLIWVNVTGQGVSRYEPVTDTFTKVSIGGLPDEWLTHVAGIGSYQGMSYFLHSQGELVAASNGQSVYRKRLAQNVKQHYFFTMNEKPFLALYGEEGGLSVYDLSNIEAPPQALIFSPFPISSISTNNNGRELWIGTEAGQIYTAALKDGKLEATNMAPFFPQFSTSRRKILSITQTDQDLLWVGTDGDGVFKFLTKEKPFYAIGPTSGQARISNSIVRSVFEDSDGTVYVGTRSGGLNIISPHNNSLRVINTDEGLSNGTVLSIAKDRDGNLWLGTDGEGIDMLEAKTNRLYHFPRDFADKPTVTFGNVYDICIDVYGTLWLGTSGHGVVQLNVKRNGTQYELESHRTISYDPANAASSINSNVVYTIVEEMPNIMWFGTRGAGIYRYNSITNKIEEHFYTGSAEANRLSNDDVLSLHRGPGDDLWIGTSGGLNRLALERRSYSNTHYTNYEGLPNNTIHGILEDDHGNIWLSTNNGLIYFDPVRIVFRTINANDGLQNNEFTDGASFKSPAGDKLYFGGISGLDVILPGKVDTAVAFPRLSISEFQVHNMIITPSDSRGILKQHIDETNELVLAHDQNFISFHFTTLDYWHNQRIEYAYFLENFDKDWNTIGTQNVVNLTNIPPGSYNLLINYKKNGTWNPRPKQIAITVNPPFWKTRWAYALYVALVLGVQAAIILFVRDRARAKRAAAIDKFKMQQMKELGDYKLQFFTNIAHEFRTPLTLIMGPVATLIKRASSRWEHSQLKTIYNNSVRMQKLIDELLQFRKIESGKDNLNVQEAEIIGFTQEIVHTFAQHASDHDVHLEFMPQVDSLKGWIDKRKIEKVLINLISNAIKYNVKGGTVDIVVYEEEGNVCFTIKDSGVGIEPEVQNEIFEAFYNNPKQAIVNNESTGIGLSLTRSLVHMHHGKINLRSSPGKGTTFNVTVPIRQEDYKTSGTNEDLMMLSPVNLAENISQEFNQSSEADGTIPFDSAHHGKIVHSVLIVDDNDQILILLRNILSDKYHIHAASDGHHALRILDEEKIDLVISDVVMPDIDGFTLCRKIKDNILSSHIPVILLTAKGEIEDRIEGLQTGADSYIPKPFHPEHLFTRIEKLIANREQERKKFANLATVVLDDISTGIGEKDDQFFGKITTCIEKHLADSEFTADKMADEIGMSKASLYKKVKALTNQTPHGLIKQYRLRKAADLLKTTNMSVSEVIYETGFNSRSYFYKSFNEMFHCHPRDFGARNAS